MAALLKNIGVDLIATVPARSRKVDFRRIKKRLGPHDALFEWKKPDKVSPLVEPDRWKALPELLSVRLLRLSLVRHGFRTQHLVVITTLLDPKLYPKDQILATQPGAGAWRCVWTTSRRLWAWKICAASARKWSKKNSSCF